MPDSPNLPQPFEPLAHRRFSFYPPILNVEHNEWTLRKATWAEVLVNNPRSGVEFWIPRRYLGEISSVDEPVMIVGLNKELEYKAGAVWPHERRVLEMPQAINEPTRPEPERVLPGPRPVPPRARTASPESRAGRLIAYVLGGTLLLCVVVFAVYRAALLRPVKFTSADQDFLQLTRTDDYFAVVRKLGPPAGDRWRPDSGELQYRALWYPERSYYIVLLGNHRNDARYVGALDRNWRLVHYVELPGGGDTASMLRNLKKF